MSRRPSAFIDGKPAGAVDMNQTIDIAIESGHHTLQVRSGRDSSRIKTFDAAEGETIAHRRSGKSILPIFLLSFFVPSPALSLIREYSTRRATDAKPAAC